MSGFFASLCVLVGACLIVGDISCESGKRQARHESERCAVETGHAEYYLNEKHERAFRWKPLNGGAK